MFVRTASERDLPAVSSLIAETAHATFDPLWGAEAVETRNTAYYSAAELKKKLDRPRSEFLVADDGKVIGGVAFAAAKGDDVRIVELEVLLVQPDLQGRGIGGMLLEEIEASFFESELMRVTEVDERNARALAFYAGAGYVEVSRKLGANVPTMLLTLEKPLV
jgi:ribosomal protein S18 acetylase RimI-like enzyme